VIGFLLTLIYIALMFLRVEDLFPALAPYSPMLALGSIAVVCSLPNVSATRPFARRETHVLLMFFCWMMLSDLLRGWPGGAILAAKLFVPCVFAFFLIATNVTSRAHLRVLLWVVLGCSMVLVGQSLAAYYTGYRADELILVDNIYGPQGFTGETVLRIQGTGWLGDPNDFAQFLLTAIPLAAMLLLKGRWIRNFFFAAVPAAILTYGVILTRSRGALVGIALVVLFALRNKVGRVGSAVISVLVVVGLLAAGVSGGRSVGFSAGSDRLDIWSDGFDVFRSNPLIGVGFNRFGDFSKMTAHNSYLLCMTELGVIGFTLWMGLMALTILRLNRTIASGKARLSANDTDEARQRREEHRQAQWCRVALIAFLSTAWFLSRTYAPLLFIVLGIALVVNRLAEESAPAQEAELPQPRWIRTAVVGEFCSFALLYAMIRVFHAGR
jgi:putative inorganic carbon (HCO3(-)) transporter